MRWLMVEASDRILPELDPPLATYAADRLRERGIEIRTDTRLVSIEDGHRSSQRRVLDARPRRVVWTAGCGRRRWRSSERSPRRRPRPGPRRPDAPRRRHRRALGGRRRCCGPRPRRARPDRPPPTAQHALRQAKRLAENIAADPGRLHSQPFRYRNKGMLCSRWVTIRGRRSARGAHRGFPAWFLHRTYHLFYMPTLGRKVRIALDWTVALLFPRDLRAARFARTSAGRLPAIRGIVTVAQLSWRCCCSSLAAREPSANARDVAAVRGRSRAPRRPTSSQVADRDDADDLAAQSTTGRCRMLRTPSGRPPRRCPPSARSSRGVDASSPARPSRILGSPPAATRFTTSRSVTIPPSLLPFSRTMTDEIRWSA